MNDRVVSSLPVRSESSRCIGEHLVELGLLSASDVQLVLDTQRDSGLPFGVIALRRGLIDRDALCAALAKQYCFPLATPDASLSPELVVASQSTHPAAESIRSVRMQLNRRWRAASGTNAVAVVSAERGEGRTFIAANLAAVYAQCNVRTLLIDMDLRHPRQHELFGMSNRFGLSSILVGRAGLEQIQAVRDYRALAVLTSGPIPPNPQELLDSALLRPVLDALRFQYEVIVVDTPSWSGSADAQAIAADCGAAILVSRPDRAAAAKAKQLLDALAISGAHALGAVMNAV